MSLTTLVMTAIGTGTGLSAYGTLKEGKETVSSSKLERSILYKEAESVRQAGAYEAGLKATEANQVQGTNIANIAAGGGTITGSKLLGLVNNYVNFEADKRMIMRNAELQAASLKMKGQLGVYQARKLRQAARIRATADIAMTAGMMASALGNKKPELKPGGSGGQLGRGAIGTPYVSSSSGVNSLMGWK